MVLAHVVERNLETLRDGTKGEMYVAPVVDTDLRHIRIEARAFEVIAPEVTNAEERIRRFDAVVHNVSAAV